MIEGIGPISFTTAKARADRVGPLVAAIDRLASIPGHEAPWRSVWDRENELVRPGMRAVDLGAAPGGWTWVLAQRGLRVEAIDNGPLHGMSRTTRSCGTSASTA